MAKHGEFNLITPLPVQDLYKISQSTFQLGKGKKIDKLSSS